MDDLIKALQILRKYGNPENPTHCEHDELIIAGINPKDVSRKDKQELDELGFFITTEGSEQVFKSFRFGAA